MYPVRCGGGESGDSGGSGESRCRFDVYTMVNDTLDFVETLLKSQGLWPAVLPDAMPCPGNPDPPSRKSLLVTPTVLDPRGQVASREPVKRLDARVTGVASKPTRAGSVHWTKTARVHGAREPCMGMTRARSVHVVPAGTRAQAATQPGVQGVQGVRGVHEDAWHTRRRVAQLLFHFT